MIYARVIYQNTSCRTSPVAQMGADIQESPTQSGSFSGVTYLDSRPETEDAGFTIAELATIKETLENRRNWVDGTDSF